MSHRRLTLVLALCALVLVAWAPPDDKAKKKPKVLPPPDTYVAMGDSFVAGPLIPPPNPDIWGCLKSLNNYPHMVAPQTGLPIFKDVSCSGAETEDFANPQGVDPDGPNPPQFDALTVTTGLVTVGIGGNDIGFSSVAEDCGGPPTGTKCQDTYVDENGNDELRNRINATAPLVDAVLDGIRARAPQAKIVVVNYLRFFPPRPLLDGLPEGCYAQLPVSPEDVAYLRGIEEALNQMLADQAAANGATLVDVYVEGHDACQPPGIRWVEPLVPIAAAPLHPNLQGMQAVAEMVLAELNS